MFSAALCRGLIEAHSAPGPQRSWPRAFSAALCRGLIEARRWMIGTRPDDPFSAALCRGLIEARMRTAASSASTRSFPRLYAAASLKPGLWTDCGKTRAPRFPRLYAAASLKPVRMLFVRPPPPGFPRLYAAASLKLADGLDHAVELERFSAALCRGLIEASESHILSS